MVGVDKDKFLMNFKVYELSLDSIPDNSICILEEEIEKKVIEAMAVPEYILNPEFNKFCIIIKEEL